MFKRKKPGQSPDGENPLARRVVRGDDSPTQPLAEDAATRRLADPGEAETRILGTPGDTPGVPADPPAAVLLIIAGPGVGNLLPVGYGMNRMGRDAGQRIRLDYGDARISREDHARLTYDGDGRQFYLQHGASSSLTYHNDKPVLEPIEVRDGARIRLGDTQLLFRTLISAAFDWQHAPNTKEP